MGMKIFINEERTISPNQLNEIYSQWQIRDRIFKDKDFLPSKWDFRRGYQIENRQWQQNQRFESWLFDNGFTVIQHDKKRYLKFSGNQSRLTFFLLTLTGNYKHD